MAGRCALCGDDVEARRPDEDRTAEEIVAAMRRIAETTLDRDRHAVRPSHAKSHGLPKGTLEVLPGLEEPLARFPAEMNGRPRREPRGIDEIPD